MKGSNVSLKEFHLVFITVSIFLALGFAYWGFAQYNQLGGGVYIGASILSFIAALGLVIYEIRFIRKTKAYNSR